MVLNCERTDSEQIKSRRFRCPSSMSFVRQLLYTTTEVSQCQQLFLSFFYFFSNSWIMSISPQKSSIFCHSLLVFFLKSSDDFKGIQTHSKVKIISVVQVSPDILQYAESSFDSHTASKHISFRSFQDGDKAPDHHTAGGSHPQEPGDSSSQPPDWYTPAG